MNRRRRVLVVVSAVLVVVAAAAGAGWQFLGEERRLAQFVARVVAGRTGLRVTIDRAATDGGRLRLSGVRVRPGPGFPLDLRVGRVEVAGGVLPLVAPAGRRVDVTAAAASVTVAGQGGGAPDATAVDGVRASARGLLDWPGALTVRVADGELVAGGTAHRFDLTAEKSGTGAVLTLSVAGTGIGAGPAAALRLDLTLAPAADGAVDAVLDLAAVPAALGALWPPAWPVPATLAARGDGRLVRGGTATVNGRVTAGGAADPVVIDLASRYDGARAELAVSRYAVAWGPALRVEGAGRVDLANGRAETTATGSVEGGRLEGRAAYRFADGGFESQATLAPLDTARVARRFGLPLPAGRVATLRARAAGTVGAAALRATVDASADGLTAAALPAALDAVLAAVVAGPGAATARVERATLTLANRGAAVAVVTAASRTASLLPLALDAAVADLARLAPFVPGAPTLAGTARARGEVARGPRGAAFAGRVETMVERGQWVTPAPLTVTAVRATLPLAWSGGALAPGDGSGSLAVARVAGWGFALTDVASRLVIENGGLVLPDVRYRHYGGQGGGRVDLAADGAVTARLGGKGVDLAGLVRELGTTAARITGRVDYTATVLLPDAAHGLDGEMRFVSAPGGGEIGIDAIQRLLESAAVQEETTGILRRTLQSLKVFTYESLEGDLRWVHGAGRLDLSLRGRKRLGLFPAPVEAINIKNVPLAVLAGTITRGTTP